MWVDMSLLEPSVNKGSFMVTHDPSVLARSLSFCIPSAGHFYANNDYDTNRSNFKWFLMLYTIDGCGCLEYRAQQYPLGKGQIFVIDCNERHRYYAIGNAVWEISWIHFTINGNLKYVEHILNNGGPAYLLKKGSILPARIQKVIDTLASNDLQQEIKCSSILDRILTELLLDSINHDEQASQMPEVLKETINYIEINFSAAVSLDVLSRLTHVNKFHLEALFKKYTGDSIYRYLLKYRMNIAKIRLQNTQTPVNFIAREVGFNDTSQFIRMFKKYEGITPLKYRKNWGALLAESNYPYANEAAE